MEKDFSTNLVLSSYEDVTSSQGREWQADCTDTNSSTMSEGILTSSAEEKELTEEMNASRKRMAPDEEPIPCNITQQENPSSISSKEISEESESNIRWVKRLKLSPSHSPASDTKCSGTENTSSEKVDELCSRILNYSRSNSSVSSKNQVGKGKWRFCKTLMLLKDIDSSSSDTTGKNRELNVAHIWVRRWQCISSPQVKPAMTQLLYESESPMQELEGLQRKQFPSIAAMALMARSINNFRPCTFRKMGSFMVWNTEET